MNGWMSGILMLWNMGIVAGLMLGGMLVLRSISIPPSAELRIARCCSGF